MSAARDLAKLGNQDALTIDTTLTRVGINSSNPTATLDIDGTVQVGTGVTVYSASGIVSATKYYADSYYGSGVNLTGVGNTDNIITGTAATFNNKVNINSTLTCSEGINVSVGVITAPSASFSGNVTIGGTLTYEDVTDIDAVGLITARTGVRVTAGGLVVTAGVSTFSAPVNINSSPNFSEGLNVSAGVATFAGNQTVAGTSSFAKKTTVNATLDATEGLHVSAGVATFVGNQTVAGTATFAKKTTVNATLDATEGLHVSAGVATFADALKVGTGASIYSPSSNILTLGTNSTEKLRITSAGAFSFNNGEFVERVKISGTALNSDQVCDLDDGMVHYRTANLGGSGGTSLDLTSSVGISTEMATGDMMSFTLIHAVNATGNYVDHVNVDYIPVTENWVGGSAPSSGGSSGVDIYTFNIIKTGNLAWTTIANQVKTS